MDTSVNMICKGWRRIGIVLIVLFLAGWGNLIFAQERKVTLDKLLPELSRQRKTSNQHVIVTWLPKEYWKLSFDLSPGMPSFQKAALLSVIDPYIIITVLSDQSGSIGNRI